jgi:uncharacterized caspase-like protein
MRKALAVGIDQYRHAPLRGCVNDASAVADIMEVHGDGTPNFDVRLEINVPEKTKLMGLIKNLFDGNCETVLFYFSGHGYLNDLGAYIVTPDARQHDEGISMDEILKIANASEVKNKIIILDCCHSGAMGSPRNAGNTATQIVPGVCILTASKDREAAMEINGHGVFTSLLLDALKGGAADLRGHITPGSVYAYIDQALGPWEQRPVFKTNVSQFTSLRTVPPQVRPEVLRKITEYFPSASYQIPLDPQFEYTQPDAVPQKVAMFKDLQGLESVGLVLPVNEKHMYWAAMNSKSCKLTALGYHYWRLVRDKRL